MLVHLSVHNYAIVEHLDLELDRGMTVVTGETGAGKSIMLDALGLALGGRADSGVVRPGADKADILASFDVDEIPGAREWLSERDLDGEGPCILRRVITAEGRSRGYINGTPCPQSDLKALGERLIDIHSQHEHQSLLKPDTHRRLLDEYSGSQELARQVQLAAQRWRQTRQTLERLSSSGDEQRARHQLLSYQLEELENLALGEQELEQLEQEHKTLTNAEQLLGACRQVMELCSESDAGNVLSALTSSLQRLTVFQHQPGALAEAVNLLASAQIQVEEAVGELNRFVDQFDADPERCRRWKNASTPSIHWRASTGSSRSNCRPCSSGCWRNWKASTPTTRRWAGSARNWRPTNATTRKRPRSSAPTARKRPSAWPPP